MLPVAQSKYIYLYGNMSSDAIANSVISVGEGGARRRKLVLKLPKARVAALVEASEGRPFDPRNDGRLMREWVVLSKNSRRWDDLAQDALRFVGGK